MKKLLIICLYVPLTFSQMFHNPFLELNEPAVLFDVVSSQGKTTITPIVLLDKNGMNPPPSIEMGKFTKEAKGFSKKYFTQNITFKTFYDRQFPDIIIKNNLSTKDIEPSSCSEPIASSAEFKKMITPNKIKQRFIVSNSELIYNQKNSERLLTKPEREDVLREVKKYARKEKLVTSLNEIIVDTTYVIESSPDVYFLIYFSLKDITNFHKNYFLLLEKRSNTFNVGLFKSLFSYNESGGDWSNESYEFIDAVDIDEEEGVELIFYEESGEGYGYQILDRSYQWRVIYNGGGGGC